MEADLHAAVLLLSIAVTVVAGWQFRSRKFDVRRIGLALVLGLLGWFLLSIMVPYVTAGSGNNPRYQLAIPLVEAIALWALIETKWIRISSFSAAMVLAVALGSHFHQLIGLGRDACRYTGDPRFIVNSCKQPAEAIALWHTPLTGLYEIRVLGTQPTRNQ
jgi:hypothetical protein